VVVFAPASLSNGASFNDTASVTASNPDPSLANNTATVTGSIVNNNPNADLAVSISGPGSANEGDTVTYNITVTNAGPSSASGVTLTDTLPSNLNYKSATASQGTFSVAGGVVTFSVGTVASGGTVTASVTALATEDGTTSDAAMVSSSSPDPNLANNSASATTTFAEPAISVSGAIRTKSHTLTNFQVATFTHANGVESANAFTATVNWGDGTTSTGTITLSGTTYIVTGSHTYAISGRHTITTSVTEVAGSGGVKLHKTISDGAAAALSSHTSSTSAAILADAWLPALSALQWPDRPGTPPAADVTAAGQNLSPSLVSDGTSRAASRRWDSGLYATSGALVSSNADSAVSDQYFSLLAPFGTPGDPGDMKEDGTLTLDL
jgi:uncharacterized repeat protein (TIGR01451 family)